MESGLEQVEKIGPIQTKVPLTTFNRASDSSLWILFTLWLLVFGMQ